MPQIKIIFVNIESQHYNNGFVWGCFWFCFGMLHTAVDCVFHECNRNIAWPVFSRNKSPFKLQARY